MSTETTTLIIEDNGTLTSDGTEVIIDDGVVSIEISDVTVLVTGDGAGPQGPPGPTGAAGPLPIYIGPTPPANTSLLWVDTSV